ncbi:MAG: type II toxin-antitoxin system VapC family toxin [Myxococcota bacterium]
MLFLDVNLLLYAHRAESLQHGAARTWLENALVGSQPLGFANIVLSSFVRVATHPRIFDPPSTMNEACEFVDLLREAPVCVPTNPGPMHWAHFRELCAVPGVKGGLVTDAYLAAIAIEHRCTFATHDADFKRFTPMLTITDPLAG